MSSTNFIDKQTLIEASWLNDVDAAVYEGTGVYTPAGTGAVATTVQTKLRESVSVKDFGAVGDGVTDDSAAFSAAWAYIKTTYENPAANLVNVTASLVVPPGKYLINTSVNWTGLVAWNIHVQMRGAVLTAGVGCAGKAVLDATGVRGLHIEGGYIESLQAAATAPLCGILIGPAGTATCGNNNFRDVQIEGVFTYAPFINIGSETTCYYNCYFAQTNTDTSLYAYVGDGLNLNLKATVTSLYTTLRGTDVAVSFTSNSFYSCHFRNYGGGSAIFVAQTSDWQIDKGCYILAFDKSGLEFYQTVTWRNYDFSVSGLYETTQGAGLKNMITFLLPPGESSATVGLIVKTGSPHYSDALFNVTDLTGAVPAGTMTLVQTEVHLAGTVGTTTVTAGAFVVGTYYTILTVGTTDFTLIGASANTVGVVFKATGVGSGTGTARRYGTLVNVASGKHLLIEGNISYRSSAQVNIYDCKAFMGILQTYDGSLIHGTAGGDRFNYMLFDPVTYGGQVFAVSKSDTSYLGLQPQANIVVMRAEGDSTDIDLELFPKGAGKARFGTLTGSADAPVTGYITIKDAGGNLRKLAVIA
jgi:hypothetical protein